MSTHHLPALILALIGAALLLRWIIGDRSRGRRRCPRCWYDMAGIDATTCPECGRTARSERALFRTRRRPRWLLAGIAIVSLTAYTATTAQARRNENWTRYVPTTLFLATDRTVTQGAPLYRRLSSHTMWDWQARIAFRRQLPPNVRQHRYQPHITYPAVWPAGMPVPLVYNQWQDSFPLAFIGRTRTVLRDPRTGVDLARRQFSESNEPHLPPPMWRGSMWMSQRFGPQNVAPALAAGTRTFDLHVELTTHWKGSGLVIQRTRITYPIQTVSRIEDLCAPVEHAELTDHLRQAMRVGPVWMQGNLNGPPRGYLGLTAGFGRPLPQFDDVAIGVRIEFLRNNEVVGTARYLVPTDNANVFLNRPQQGLDIEGDWRAILDATLDPQDWTVRVTSDLDAVFSDITLKPRYWRGQFTVPLTDVARPIYQ